VENDEKMTTFPYVFFFPELLFQLWNMMKNGSIEMLLSDKSVNE
jgi:hypothetical protein